MDISNYNIEQCDAVSVLNAIMDMYDRRILHVIEENAGVPTLTIPNTTVSQVLEPDTLYVFAQRSTALSLTLGTPKVGKANEYHLFLITGSTAPSISWPSGISWNGGAPVIAAGMTYEVSILNGIAACFAIEN